MALDAWMVRCPCLWPRHRHPTFAVPRSVGLTFDVGRTFGAAARLCGWRNAHPHLRRVAQPRMMSIFGDAPAVNLEQVESQRKIFVGDVLSS